MFVIPTLNISDVFFVLFYTYRNSIFVIPTLNISDVLFYVIPIGIRFSLFLLYTYLKFVCLCHTYWNSVFVTPLYTM